MAEDRPQPPVVPERIPDAMLKQLEKLNEAIEKQKEFLEQVFQPSAAAQTKRILDDKERIKKVQRSSNPPDPLASSHSQDAGVWEEQKRTREEEGRASGATYKVPLPAEVSFKKRLSEGFQVAASGGGLKGFNEGFLEPREPKGRLGSMNPSALPPNARMGGGGNQGRTAYDERITGDPRVASPISGMTMGEAQEMEGRGFKIPEFGDWQLDTKLKMGRDWLGQYALRQGEEQKDGSWQWNNNRGQVAGTLSGYFNYAQAHAAQIETAKKLYSHAQNWAAGGAEMGGGLGYNPQNGFGPNYILGMRNPLANLTSEAGQQGLGMRVDAFDMSKLGTGLSSDQANQIVGGLASQGFSNQQSGLFGITNGGDLNNIAQNLVAPIVKNTGMSPEVANGFAEALKDGNASIEGITKSLGDLSSISHESRENINQVGQSIQEFAATTSKEFGGTMEHSAQTAASYYRATGLDPRFLSQSMQNPIFQGLAMTRTGTLPSGIGTLTGGSLTSLQMQSMNLAMGATQGLAQDHYETVDGKRIKVGTGQEAQEAQAAQLIGMDPETFKRLYRNKKGLEARGHVETLLHSPEGWDKEVEGFEHANKAMGHDPKTFSQAQKNALEHGGKGSIGWAEISKELEAGGTSKKEIEKLSKDKFGQRTSDVEKLFEKQGKSQIKETENQVEVKFTGQAAKFFEQVPVSGAKAIANAGGSLLSQGASSALNLASSELGVPTNMVKGLIGSIGEL